MAEKLKNMFFTPAPVTQLAETIRGFYERFDVKRFLDLVFDQSIENKELKEKMRHVTLCLHETLPKSYAKALAVLKQAAPHVKGFEALCLPDYVELYGTDNWDVSLPALALFTRYSTSEFAIRPFLIKDTTRAMAFLSDLTEDEDPNVRRFASEGCRPRLPWGIALPQFRKDPTAILPILEKLKDDDSDFVRRSVANNLNDIAKDHPRVVLDVCERWQGASKNTDWIVRHACRGLLKAGNRRAMRLFGFGDPKHIAVDGLRIDERTVRIGDSVRLSFGLSVRTRKPCKTRIEYAVYYTKATGKRFRKVFKITENRFAPGEHAVAKKHSFADMSTRKHFPGVHDIAILINGVEMARTHVKLRGR